jgi:hypothetical protein
MSPTVSLAVGQPVKGLKGPKMVTIVMQNTASKNWVTSPDKIKDNLTVEDAYTDRSDLALQKVCCHISTLVSSSHRARHVY